MNMDVMRKVKVDRGRLVKKSYYVRRVVYLLLRTLSSKQIMVAGRISHGTHD